MVRKGKESGTFEMEEVIEILARRQRICEEEYHCGKEKKKRGQVYKK